MVLCSTLKKVFRRKRRKLRKRDGSFCDLEHNDESSCSSGASDSGSSVCTWVSPGPYSHQRRNLDQLLDGLSFFYGSMLDDPELQTQLLAKPGDTFLISFPLTKNDSESRCTAYKKWHLVVLEQNDIICKLKVVYQDRMLKIAIASGSSLMSFVCKWRLKPVERPWLIQSPQLTAKMQIVPQQAFPINAAAFPLGSLEQMTLNFDSLRRIPVMTLLVRNCTFVQMDFLLCEAERRKRFGSFRIWRLWGVCEYYHGAVSLVLEDIVYGSVAEYVRAGMREYLQLCQFAVQIAEGFRYLEKYEFIHRRITLDVCLLTYAYNIKIAIYGLTSGELFPTNDGTDDVDHCRWLTPRCLPHPDGPLSSYDASATVYSFGMVLWSMFHCAALPFDGEDKENIMDRNFRLEHILNIDEELVPSQMKQIILRCWNDDEDVVNRFRDILPLLRKARDDAS